MRSLCEEDFERMFDRFIVDLKRKYIPDTTKQYELQISIFKSSHFVERYLQRHIPKNIIERLLTRLVKNKLCEISYLCLINNGTSIIKLYDKESNTILTTKVIRGNDESYKLRILLLSVYKNSVGIENEKDGIVIYI